MTIWIAFGVLTLCVAAYILWPVWKKRPATAALASANGDAADGNINAMAPEHTAPLSAGEDELQRDLAVYRDQLAEIGRDIERGMLTDEQANAARIEVQRRILATDQRILKRAETGAGQGRVSRLRPLVTLFTLAALAAGFAFYLDLGRPDLPDRPIAARTQEIAAARAAQDVDQKQLAALNRAVGDLSERLKNNPNDLRGWELLGASLLALGRAEEAQTALLEAVRQSGRDGAYLAMYAEAVIRANDGQVNAVARGALEEAAKSSSTDPRIQYFLGLGDAQNGDFNAAIDRWVNLVNGAHPDDGWLPLVMNRLMATAQAQGIDLTGRITVTPQIAEETPKGPSQEDMQAAAEMTPEQRQQMIEGMVGQLAERLAEKPDNPEGWARLMQAYMVLGKADQAKQAYDTARKQFAGDSELIGRFDTLAGELGITGQ